MEFDTRKNESNNTTFKSCDQNEGNGKIFGGLILIVIGGLFLAREMGVILPTWIFSWKILLITIGFYIGFKHSFRNLKWLIPVFIGAAFLLRDIYPQIIVANYIWPIAIILFGIALILRPAKTNRTKSYLENSWNNTRNQRDGSTEDLIQFDSVFANVQKNIISKDFKGGEISVVFGGAEINLSQSDILEKATLEINTVFGGTKLIVPANWEIKSELTAVMGGIEDKRFIQKDLSGNPSKVLILKGSVVFGGVEIRSY